MAKKKRPYVPQWDPIDSWAVHQAEQQQQQQRQQPAPKQEETGFWDQARRGALGAWEQVKTLPDQLGLGLDVRNVSRATSDLGTFQQIDKGTYKSSLFDSLMPGGGESVAKRWMSGQTDEAFRQSRAAAQYSAATPQQRTDLIKSRRGALETARTSAMENVAQIGEAQKRAAPYAPAVEDFTDIRSLGDFNKWLGYSIGSGAVSSAPALGIGLLTRSPAATVGVATGMEYGSGIQDRLNFIQNKVANLPPADQANAIIQYVDATKDETLRAALASGTLELFGPEAGAIKRALIKKAATEAGQEVAKTGFKEGLKAAGKEGLEEFATGGAQQVANLNLQFALDERQGSLLDRDSLKEIFNAAMAEGAGGFAIGGGMNIIQSRGVKGKGSDTNVDDQSLIKGKEDTDLGSDVAGGTEADDTITSGTKAAEPVREPQILPTEVVKGLFNEGNVIASLSNTGIAPKYLPTLAKRLTAAFQNNNEKELDNILKAQERRLDPAHSSVKSDEDLARNEAVYGAVSQLIGNFREFHSQALQEEELLTGPSEVAKYVGEKLKQEVARAKEAQLRTQQADAILNAQRQEAELQEQQRIASEAAAREQEIAAAAKRVENIHRQGILQTVVNDPETRDPVKRFTSLLKRNNFDATVSPEEAKALEAATAKLEQRTAGEAAKAGLSVEEYKQNLPAKSLREAENLGMTPEQYMTAKGAADEMGISVPAFVQMQQEQQLARQAVQAQAPAKPPVPFFELQAEREMGPADIAAMEKAQAKRERKAQRDAAKMAEQAVEDREQLSFLTEAAPAPEVVEGKKVITPAKTGIKQRYDVGKKVAAAFEAKEKAAREKAAAEAEAAKKAPEKKKLTKRPALPKDQKTPTPEGVAKWDQVNRNNRADALFEGDVTTRQSRERAVSEAGNRAAHGMSKAATVTEAFNSLVNLLQNGIDRTRGRGGSEGRGGLDTASLAAKPGEGAAVGTATGTAYFDGAFVLVGAEGHNGTFTSTDQIAGILVNDALADTGVVEALREMFPSLSVETYSNTSNLLKDTSTAPKKVPAKRPALPKDQKTETKVVEKPAPKEKKRAAQKRKKPASGVSQRVRTSEERKAPEAGRGNRPEQGREKPKAVEEKVKAPSAEEIGDRIYDYTAELDRTGLIKYARSLHKQGVISKDDINEIERMSKDRDMGVEDIANELSGQVDVALNPKAEPAPAPLSYEDVLKEAETYLAEDGETGLLKPTEYQQLSILAEQGKVSPQDLMDRMEAIVTQRSEKAVSGAALEAPSVNAEAPGRTKAIAEVIAVGRKTGKAVDVLKAIAKQGGFIGRAARRMAKVIGDVDVVIMSRDEFIKWRTARGLADRPQTKTAAGEFYRQDGKVYLVTDMGHERVAVHEMGHAITASAIDNGTPEGKELDSLYKKYLESASDRDKKRYGLRNTHEFVAEIWSNRLFREYLTNIQYAGTDLLSRFKRIFVRLTGMPIGDVRRVLNISEQIAKREADERAAFRGELLEGPSVDNTLAGKNMPDKVGSFAKNIGKRFLSATDENLTVYGFTENLIEDAQKLIPSTKKYLTSMRDRMMKKEEMTRHIDGIRSKFVGLGLQRQGVGSGTINGFLQNTVNTEKWGFQPDWLDAEVEVDPDLEAEFKRLPAKEQEIVKEALKTSYDTLKTKIDTVIEAVNSNYETLILKAMDENNEKKVAKLELEQKNALAEYRGLFAARKDKPYITTRRFGDYMVVAKSADMHTAVELGDKKLVEEMKGQEDHYFVQRYDTLQEARDARQKLIESGAFKDGTVVAGEVDKTYQQFVGSRDMMLAYDRLRKLIQNQVAALDENNKVNAKVIANMERMAVDLQLLALKQTSARKSELRKLGVAAGEMDMMRNFVAQGAADAHMISSLMYSKKIDEAIEGMRKEAFSDFSADPEKARRFYNELMLRHAAGMAYEHSNMAETIKTVTSMMMLSLSPSYYLTNMTQPWVLSVPYMAGEHSYAKVNAEMLKSYGEVAKAWGDLNVTDPLDLSKVSSDVRTAIEELANRGRIDIGVDKEIGAFHSLDAGTVSNAFDKSGAVIRALSQKIESINRVSTAAAAYRLAVAKGKSHEQAVDYADKVIRMTHGTYDGFNAPRWMRGPVASTITQFKKFQLMQVTLLWKLLKNSISKADTREAKLERAVARRQFAFTMWHTMALAGLRGMPGMTAVIFLWNLIVGAMDDDDEPEDIEQEIRDAIGKDYAELILTGAPSLAGIDISDRVGMGQAFSIMPYTDIKFSREGFFSALAGLLGPGAALVGKAGDAANALYKYGDYYGALGKLLPNGIDDAYAAVREATGGVKRGGDTVIDPEDIDFAQTFARAMGVMTTERAERLRKQDRNYSVREALKNRSGQITRAYVEARDSGDAEARKAAEEDWKALQVERERLGEKKQPLSNLLKAYRARETKRKSIVKGVEYSPKSEALRRAQEEAEAEDEE